MSELFSPKTPVKWISGFMMAFGGLLGLLWIMMSLSFVLTGEVPQPITQTDHPTGVVFASDLSLLIPAVIFNAVLLWRRHPWGYVLSSIVLIKCNAYGMALIIMKVVSYMKEGIIDPFILLWIALTIGSLLSTIFLLGNMKKQREGSFVS